LPVISSCLAFKLNGHVEEAARALVVPVLRTVPQWCSRWLRLSRPGLPSLAVLCLLLLLLVLAALRQVCLVMMRLMTLLDVLVWAVVSVRLPLPLLNELLLMDVCWLYWPLKGIAGGLGSPFFVIRVRPGILSGVLT
jgi:hypothetical protein